MASTTPKLDRIINMFKSLMGEPATYTGDNLNAGDVLTVELVEEYISKAMFKLFNSYWLQAVQKSRNAQEAARKILTVFPELARRASIVITGGVYTFATPNLDIFVVYGAYEETSELTYPRILDASFYPLVYSERYPQYTASAAKPIIIQMQNQLNYFPAGSHNYSISFIKIPVIPTTGGILEQNGGAATPDSPFREHWEPLIAEMADEIYRQERKTK